ncbi:MULTISPECIES: glycerophosphodiester phosphodiesterase family protein [Arthrobacter]|uniref:Glycerophosphodiester phosphodiesterase family protein n=2 Tax=Arthrobacter TaxID=1663 RepID=A0ABU9KIT6_9MICC|nr:glycerophosphodiester phosphodiesterase family protein [Arthrobacter sp. YJM1]MDP5226952.1 glycerophosphodiester phosphodiesterase family protein [Arthrobacter sp. YJM1]
MNVKEYFRNPLGEGKPLILAHRGYRRGTLDGVPLEGLENTLQSFRAARELGVTHLETDLRLSADGEILCFHDPILDRVTDRTGVVSRLSWDEIRTARVRGRVPVPRLADVVDLLPDARFNLDVKDAAVAQPLAALIEEKNLQDRVLVTSFSDGVRKAVTNRVAWPVATSAGKASTAALLFGKALRPGWLESLLAGVDAFQVPEKSGRITVVTREFVERAHELGKQVHVWTVNEEADMTRLLDLGVDGLVTDCPEVALRLLG